MKRKLLSGIGIVFLSLLLAPIHWLWAESSKSQLNDLTARLQKSPDDQELRKKIIKLVSTMPKKPEIPDGLDELMGKAEYVAKNAAKSSDYLPAVEAYQQASLLAPWDADIYYNLGVMQEKAEKTGDAVNSFKLYLLGKPNASDKRKVKKRIGALEYVAKTDNLDGAVFVYTMPESMNPNGTTEFKMTIRGDEVIQTAKYTDVTATGYQNGARLGQDQPMGTGTLSGKQFKMPLDDISFAYYVISPDGQSISRCDPSGHLVDVGNPNVPFFKRISTP